MKKRLFSLKQHCNQLLCLAVLGSLMLVASGRAAEFTWDGTTNTWPSVHWLDVSSTLVAGGTGAAISDTYTINGGTVLFTDHDTFGNDAANPALTINVNGGVLSNEAASFATAFTTLGLVNLNGGTITSTGGAVANYQAFQFKNTVTSTGTSLINTTGTPANFNGFHVTNNTFNVTSGSLAVSAPLLNAAGGTSAGFTKSGAGTMTLSAANALTGNVISNGGILEVASGGSLTNIRLLNTKSGGNVTVGGSVTITNGGSFGVGAGATGTTGSVTVTTGGTLNIGGGGGFTGVGGRDATANALGNGTLTISGGTLNVAAPGTSNSGLGLDATNFWMNPYGTGGGTSTIHLDGGLLSTARSIAQGTGGSNAIFNFNGGTLQAAGSVGLILNSLSRINVRNGAARIDTQGFNVSINTGLLHSDIGGDDATDGGLIKTGSGNLTLSSGASSFTGNILVSGGTLTASGAALTATPTSSSLGNMTLPGRTVTIDPGASLVFGANDPIGSTVSNPSPIIVNNGTLSHGAFFVTMGNITLNNGSTMTGGNGVVPGFQSVNLRGSVTVSGTGASTITTTGTTNLGYHLGSNTFNEFIVGETGVADDLTVNVPLLNRPDNNTGAGSLRKSGDGNMVLTAANTYTGSTLVNGGTLVINGGSIAGPGLIDIGANAATPANFTLASGSVTAGSQFVIGAHGSTGTAAINGGALQVNGTIYIGGYAEGTGTGTLQQTAGTVTSTAGINFGGGGPNNGIYNLNGGTLTTTIISKSGGGTATFNFNGGTLRPSAASATFLQGLTSANVQNGGALIDTNGVDITIAQPLLNGGTGGLTKSGAGTLTIPTNASTYAGNVNVSEGTLSLTGGLLGSAPTSGALGDPSIPGRVVIVGNGASLLFRQHDVLGNDAANPQLSIVVNGGTIEAVPGVQAGYNGPFNILPAVTLNGGTILSANGALAPVQSFSLKGDITVGGSTASTIGTTGTPALLNGVHLTKAGGVTFNVADATASSATDLTVSAPLISAAGGVGPGALIKSGVGTMELTTVNTYTGATTIQQGTLSLSGSGSVASTLIDVQTGSTFDVSATTFTLGSGQALKANGTVVGLVTTSNGSTLSGAGSIDGAVVLNGSLTPGNSPGTLTLLNDAFTFGSASTALFELGGTGTSSYDRVVGIDALTLDGTISVVYFGGFTPTFGNSFDLFDFASSNAAAFNVGSDLVLPTLDSGLSWDVSSFTSSGIITVVPEPSSMLLGGLALICALRRRR